MPVGIGAPEGGFFDAMPLHFVNGSSLAEIARLSPAAIGEAARFRPNIVIDTDDAAPFAENGWAGSLLAIGDALRIAVLFPTPRCAVPALRHGDLAPDPEIVRRLTRFNRVPVLHLGEKACLGAYGRVVTSGPIRAGDRIELHPS